MDWYLPAKDAVTVTALRHQIRDYLRRHAEPDSDVDGAELIAQELMVNAIEHTSGPAWVRLSWSRPEPDLEVWDLGLGFDRPHDLPDSRSIGGRGLLLVSHLATEFEIAARQGGGTHVSVVLPVRRAISDTIDPGPLPHDPLPDLAEAGLNGEFGKESFLRALVVQLAQAIEFAAGPEVGEQSVTQVGLAVGAQMEAAYRATHAIVGRLTAQQLADCYVRLKRAIDGDFRAVEISEDRIVLENSRCPFGEVVRRSPALCRMTSSVFGGIAAHNSPDGSAVYLEERIAIGDPGCRVVVYFGAPPAEVARFSHRYPAPLTDASLPSG
jgi:anti-sigma regulatory factor (Ser/Thr protein kinase)/predicted ArsR family transcriptional regulator